MKIFIYEEIFNSFSMDKSELLEDLFDSKIINIIKLFLANKDKDFYLKEISDTVRVPMASTHRVLKKLVRLEIIIEKNISKFKVYCLAQNEKVIYLRSFIKESQKVIEMFISRIRIFSSIKRVILHGKENENKANILIIGKEINSQRIKEIVADIKEDNNYHISYMVLTDEQYEQMSNMGLYSGTKKLLYEAE